LDHALVGKMVRTGTSLEIVVAL